MMLWIINLLKERVAIAKVSSDNAGYLIKITIKEAEEGIAELEQKLVLMGVCGNARPKLGSELSETPVIAGEQATAPAQEQMLSAGTRLRAIRSLSWLIEDARYRHDDCKNNIEKGSEGGYSPELTEAGVLLDELKGITPTIGKNELEAAYRKGFEDAKIQITEKIQALVKR